MTNEIEGLIAELESAVTELPEEWDLAAAADRAGRLAERFAAWRRVVCSQDEGELRERAVWALLGAERHMRVVRAAPEADPNALAARLRLEAAIRALREMLPGLESSPTPLSE